MLSPYIVISVVHFMKQRYLSIKNIVDRFDVTRRTVYRWKDAGLVMWRRKAGKGHYVTTRKHLDNFFEKHPKMFRHLKEVRNIPFNTLPEYEKALYYNRQPVRNLINTLDAFQFLASQGMNNHPKRDKVGIVANRLNIAPSTVYNRIKYLDDKNRKLLMKGMSVDEIDNLINILVWKDFKYQHFIQTKSELSQLQKKSLKIALDGVDELVNIAREAGHPELETLLRNVIAERLKDSIGELGKDFQDKLIYEYATDETISIEELRKLRDRHQRDTYSDSVEFDYPD
jgi:DNA-binding transcriptional MerR regulator